MDLNFDVDPEVFQERKRRRISDMNAVTQPAPKVAPISTPSIHEIGTFLPGRLEFEHELDNDAEDLVKDLEFGICHDWGGDEMPEDDQDPDVRARAKLLEDGMDETPPVRPTKSLPPGKGPPAPKSNGIINGYHINGDVKKESKNGRYRIWRGRGRGSSTTTTLRD